ncbi:MAG: thiamine-phosphate kinase [Candidatus Thiodiazotropha sp.]
MRKRSDISEFDLINDYFACMTAQREDVALGIGDDAALLRVPQGMELAVSVDTLVAGVHFFPDISPSDLGHKVLAVNLSDLAAMGAEPAWATLALTLPGVDGLWISEFCRGFSELAAHYDLQLVGGDTTSGPLSITVQVQGLLPMGEGLTRSGAQVGDDIYVTGTLGDAALALVCKRDGDDRQGMPQLLERLDRPIPRVEAGIALRGFASSVIDISDGLAADLGHILQSSGVGASVDLDRIPLSPPVTASLKKTNDWSLIIAGGDDYELCFTLPPVHRDQVASISRRIGVTMTRVGVIDAQTDLRCLLPDGSLWSPEHTGYEHFSRSDGDN